MKYNVKNVSNQLIVCTLKDGSSLYLFAKGEENSSAIIKDSQLTDYLKEIEKLGMIVISPLVEAKVDESEKKKSPKSDNVKKEEK